MDGLSGDIFALEIGVGDGFGDVGEVHGLLVIFEDDIDLVADVFRIDSWPFGETPETIDGGELL